MPSIHEVKGVGPTMAAALSEKGILTPEQLAGMQADDLLMVEGVGPARAIMLIDAAKEAIANPVAAHDQSDGRDAQAFEERTSTNTSLNDRHRGDDKTAPKAAEENRVPAVQEEVEETIQIAAKISDRLKAAQSWLEERKKVATGKSTKSGEAKKAKGSKNAKKAKKAKSDTAIKVLKKEVKKRRAALKRQKQKLKQARKALKAIV